MRLDADQRFFMTPPPQGVDKAPGTIASDRAQPKALEIEPWLTPNLRAAMDDIVPIIVAAVGNDRELGEALRRALALAASWPRDKKASERSWGPALGEALAFAVGRLQAAPDLARLGLSDAVVDYFVRAWLVKTTTGEDLPPLPQAAARVRALPGIPVDAVRTLLNGADVETLTGQLAPGQIWVLMNDIDHRSWPRVSALVQYQRRALGLDFGTPGRPMGSRPAARVALIAQIRQIGRASCRERV